jgi:hypothetical protein
VEGAINGMKKRQKPVLSVAVCLALSALFISVACAFRYRGIDIETSSFSTRDTQALATELRDKLGALDRSSFSGRTSNQTDITALDQYIDTVQAHGVSEHWKNATFKISVVGKTAAAGFDIQYRATTRSGRTVVGGGTIVTDRPAANALLRSVQRQ